MIYVECRPDFILVRSVTTIPRKEIDHEFKGKGEICNRLEGQRSAQGLIDEDPSATQPAYLKKLVLSQELPQQGLRVLHDKSRDNSLVVLCPTLESWILKAAEEAGIDMVRKYSLPDDPAKFHHVINFDLGKFEKLLGDLRNSDRVKTLSRLLHGAR